MKRAIVIMLLPLLACAQASESGDQAPPPRYAATAVGRIDSAGEARQLVASVDGVIVSLAVERGDAVRSGQPLLAIDCAPRVAAARARQFDAERAKAAARLVGEGARSETIAEAQAQHEALAAVERNQQQRLLQAEALIGRGFISRRELDARRNDHDRAVAESAAAVARLSLLRNGARPTERTEAGAMARASNAEAQMALSQARQCTLRSPIDGQVLQVLRREGEFSGASQGVPLIVVGNISQRIVRAEVSERDAALVMIGTPAEVWIEGQPRRWRAQVSALAGVMGRRSARSLDPTDRFDRDVREAILTVEDPGLPALVGMRVTVGFQQ